MPLPRGMRSDTTSESKNRHEVRELWGDSPSRTHFPGRLLVVSGYSGFPPDKLGVCGVRDLSNAEDEGAEVQNKIDVECNIHKGC